MSDFEKVSIFRREYTTDAEGFPITREILIASTTAQVERKKATEKWTNNTVLQNASAIFHLRRIPGVEITRKMFILCGGKKYNINSVENVRNRGIWYQIVATEEVQTDAD